MKATLVFNLPEEKYEYDAAVKGAEYESIIDSALQEIRKILKYGTPSEETVNELEKIRSILSNSDDF